MSFKIHNVVVRLIPVLLLILAHIDIPLISWPINDIFPKYSFLSWISLTLLGYSFLAILDIIPTGHLSLLFSFIGSGYSPSFLKKI